MGPGSEFGANRAAVKRNRKAEGRRADTNYPGPQVTPFCQPRRPDGGLRFSKVDGLPTIPVMTLIIALSGEVIADLSFVVVTIVGATVAGFYCHGKVRERTAAMLRQLDQRGYVISHVRSQQGGHYTEIWEPFPDPVPLYLQISDQDPVQVAAGNLGIKDIRVGHDEFDHRFVIRSNRPQEVPQLIDEEWIGKFLPHANIRFATGSCESLYNVVMPGLSGERKRQRLFWMLSTRGHISDEEAMPFLEIGRYCARRIQDWCATRPSTGHEECLTGPFEAR